MDDCFFKQQGGKRVGLVCRECDLQKKRDLYHSDLAHREHVKARTKSYYEANKPVVSVRSKAYREANAERVRASKAAYHRANADLINARSRAWAMNNKERNRAVTNAYRAANLERLTRLAAERYAANKEIFAERRRDWIRKNPGMSGFYSRSYMAACLKRTPPWADMKAIRQFYANTPPGYSVDHIVPLRGRLVSGLHVESNLQYLTRSENSKKRNHFDPDEYQHHVS